MRLEEITANPTKALDYMERVVNAGSPSGHTFINTSSKETNPFFCERYKIRKLWVDSNIIKQYGELPDFCSSNRKNDFLYIHPDWLGVNTLPIGKIEDAEWVIPTSSSRTVRMDNMPYYLKLCYPGMLGRMDRELKYSQLISGVELTEILKEMKANKNRPKLFEFMPEIGGKILKSKNIEMGYLVRYFPCLENDTYFIPAFSIFYENEKDFNDISILAQILSIKDNKEEFFLEEICYPLIDIFFYCALNEGLILEMHAQNVLYSFDTDWNVKKIILRDLESVDKDIAIRRNLGKSSHLLSYPYKCRLDSDYDYFIRHSFMYDHKLGEYLLDPLVKNASKYLLVSEEELRRKIKQYVRGKYCNEINAFFSDENYWYKYPKTMIDRSTKSRPFIKKTNPQYR